MAKQDKRNPGSWFRWQMRPRIDEKDEKDKKAETPSDPGERPTAEELKQEETEKLELEKGDLPALIGSAMLTLFPICVLVLAVMCLLAWLLIVH